jgi:hypothetical protein
MDADTTTMEENKMNEFRLTCEQFLATAREHFFTKHELCTSQPVVPDDESVDGGGGETRHRLHTGA